MSDQGNRRIQPERFAPADKTGQTFSRPDKAISDSENQPRWQSYAPALLVGALVLVAIVVISFPLFVDTSANRASIPSSNDSAQETAVNTPQATPSESPWVDSQLMRARREAQGILEQLLNVQESLENGQVEFWAGDQYEQIKQLAIDGDAFYQDRQFEQALGQYQQALESAQRLNDSIPEVTENLLTEGQEYLEENRVSLAMESLNIARLLRPNDEEIQATLQSAEVRPDILDLMDQSEQLARREEQLEQAREKLLEARAMDPAYDAVSSALADIENRIQERNFRQLMSAGFSALANAKYAEATRAFEAARQIKPSDNAVDEALQQVEAAKLNNDRQTALSRATRLESEERWAEAHEIYQSLLAEDTSLSAARLGDIRTGARLELDNRIQEIIEDPLSLQSDSAWQAGNQTLAEARAIIDPGERLTRQISQLQDVLKNARTPVMVKLESDNRTEVEIYRVGKLGAFVEQAVNLNPGNYVIVGRRSGYKDVRIELAIDGSRSEIQVPVICHVAI